MSGESHAAKRLRSSHQMSKGSSGNCVNSSDGSIYQAASDAPPDREVSKALRPSALQADAAHSIAQAAAPLPAATCLKFDAATRAPAVAPAGAAAAAAEPSHTFPNPFPPCAAASNTTLEIFSMGFDDASVRHALDFTGGDEQQALEMLLGESVPLSSSVACIAGGAPASNPAHHASSADTAAANLTAPSSSRLIIFSMGFFDVLVQRALVEAGGNEQAAIEMLIDGLYPDATAPPKKMNSKKTLEIFSMGFDDASVRHALDFTGGDEQRALEMLLGESVPLSSSVACIAGGAPVSNPLATATSKPRKQAKKKGSKPPTRPPNTLLVDRSVFTRVRGPLRQLHEAMLPCLLACTLLCVHAKRSLQPMPPFPPYLHLQFLPLQLQRFLRSFVLSIAHRLITPVVVQHVYPRTKSRWIHHIFVRVMSAFVARAKVSQQCVHCSVLSLRACLLQALE
jgi:hypothetical protein